MSDEPEQGRTGGSSAAITSQNAERRAPDPEPTYSLAALARSWAEITGEAWENVLCRLGDWAITDAFPDDAFLTSGAGDTTFHKKVIFDRVRWHRDLVDKIRGVQDPKEKARLQQFADAHLQVAEVAVLRLDVVMEACRAMDVAPPPILGLVVGVSAKHRVPPECAPDSAVGVYAREAERDQAGRHHGEVMAPDEADKYTLLWDAAREMSRNNERDVEWNWLKLLDAFWRGDLAPDGLTYFYPAPPAGRECVVLGRAALAGLLLGPRALETGAASIEDLRHWRVADYRNQPSPFGAYFEHDPEGRLGFAVLTQELMLARRSEDFGAMTELPVAHVGLAGDQTAAPDTVSLRSAPKPEIHKAITAAYDNAETASAKPPNLKEIIEPVQGILSDLGYKASGSQIQKLAGAPQYQARRRLPGKTVASEKRRKSE